MFYNLQISGVELHVANFLKLDLLDLMAVLLLFVPASLLWLVGTDQSFLLLAHRLDGLLLALVTDFPGLLLAVLGVAVFLGLEVAVLLLDREGEDVGEFLAVPVDISLANLYLDLAGNVIAALCRLPCTDNSFGSITIVFGALVPLAVKFHGVSSGHVVDNLLLHVAIRCLDIGTLVIILSGHVDLVGGVAHSV